MSRDTKIAEIVVSSCEPSGSISHHISVSAEPAAVHLGRVVCETEEEPDVSKQEFVTGVMNVLASAGQRQILTTSQRDRTVELSEP